MLTRADESDLIDDIKEGIGIALEWRGASATSIDSIKLNKLVYLAVQRLEVPLTFGWYKYGPAPVDLQYSETAVSATSQDDLDAPHESRIPDRGYYSPMEYAYFFDETLDEFDVILQARTKEFLISFYEREAPEPYGNLYVKNAQLQQILDEIKSDDTWHDDADVYYREVSQRIGELTRELMKIESLREVQAPFRLYARFLKQLIANASAQDALSASQQRFIKRIVDYYYGGAWKYVALKISENTVPLSPGNNKDKLLTSIENNRQEMRSDYQDDLDTFKERAVRLDLAQETARDNSVSPSDSGSNEPSDRERAELWSRASAEALNKSYKKSETPDDRS
ncbi:hypothetical protein [Haladaptatus sp. DYSN1]|uniref:hypothetical protein n=1 Tax=unclassified Haladaptatus TaxID=2622732 RepID=UPI002404CB20|nr:hypothetical protein [Haladaptatus sp. DYSN1]